MKTTHTPPAVVDVDPTPADILRCAALYLQRHGWGRDCFYGPELPFPTACALAAIHIAVIGRATTDVADRHRDDITHAVNALADHIDDTWHGYFGRYSLDPRSVVEDFNDHDGRITEQVITALQEAADAWDLIHITGGETA